MKSPFPGMDPFLEATPGLWEGFHNRLIHRIDDALAPMLPSGYTIDTAVRSYVVLVEQEGKDENLAKPDVAILETKGAKKTRKSKGGVAVAEPSLEDESVPMEAFLAERFEETFVEIYAEDEERVLVTCIEVLSPSNKRSGTEGWAVYQRKRQAMLLGQANFIEIDLLRGGTKMPMLNPWPNSPYSLLVSRSIRAPRCRCWRGHFRHRLPPIPVPLIEPDKDLTLDLQPLIDGIYSLGRYGERIRYGQELAPPLPDDDAAWVREQLKGRPVAGRSKRRKEP
jgi:hypothetical protein